MPVYVNAAMLPENILQWDYREMLKSGSSPSYTFGAKKYILKKLN